MESKVNTDFNVIVNEWAYRVNDGQPDPKKFAHLYQLSEVLIEQGWPLGEIDKLLQNLREQTGKKLTKQGVLDILKKDSGLEQQGSVKTKIYGDMDESGFKKILKKLFKGVTNIKSYEPRTGSNQSGRDKLFVWKWEDDEYQVHLARTSVTGRGAAQTKDQELSWLLFLSGMQYGASPTDKEVFISTLISNSEVYNRVDGVTQGDALKLASFLEQNVSWYKSHEAQCKKFISLVSNKQPKKYVKDGSTLQVNKLAKTLYKQDYGKTLDLDKWNPADVWLEYGSIPTFKTLAEYNNWLVDSLHNGTGWIGVSLKKGGGKVGIVNDYERKEYTLSGIDTKYGGLLSQGVSFTYKGTNLGGLGLNFRIFQGKSTEVIRGEGTAKGAEAVQGKVALPVIDDFKKGIHSSVIKVKGVSVEKDSKTKEWIFSSKGKANFKTVKTAFGNIKGAKFDDNMHGDWSDAFSSQKKFLDRLNTHPKIKKMAENSVKANINARFQSIVLGSMISNLSKTDLQKVMVGMLKYGKSESDWSSVHYKAQ